MKNTTQVIWGLVILLSIGTLGAKAMDDPRASSAIATISDKIQSKALDLQKLLENQPSREETSRRIRSCLFDPAICLKPVPITGPHVPGPIIPPGFLLTKLILEPKAFAEFIIETSPDHVTQQSTIVDGDMAVIGTVNAQVVTGQEMKTHKLSVTNTINTDKLKAFGVEAGYANISGSIEAQSADLNGKVHAHALESTLMRVKEGEFAKMSAQFGTIQNIDSNSIKANQASISGGLAVNEIGAQNIGVKSIEASLSDLNEVHAGTIDVGELTAHGKLEAKSMGTESIAAEKAELKLAVSDQLLVVDTIQLGERSTATDSGSAALGTDVHTRGNNSFAVGKSIVNDKANSFVVGFDKPGLSVVKARKELSDFEARVLDSQLRAIEVQIAAEKANRDRYLDYIERYGSRYRRYVSYWQRKAEQYAAEIEALQVRRDELEAKASSDEMMVGIGTAEPTRTMHISGAMKLEPLATPPANPSMGDLYVNQTGALCVYLQDQWDLVAGEGVCNETIVRRCPGFGPYGLGVVCD